MTKIIIATLMRPSGETGVQTHFNGFIQYLSQLQVDHRLITPFSYHKILVYPVFALRKLIHPLSGELSVWWYRYWHALFLKHALKKYLATNDDCVIYAQCPLSAAAALAVRKSARQKIIMVVHFNLSQADEWVGKGLITPESNLYRTIKKFEATVLPQLNGLVCVSAFMQRELLTLIPAISKVATAIIPNFITDPGLPSYEYICTDLICIGTLEPRKNQKYLLEIIAALQNNGLSLTVTIIGDGPDHTMLEETAKKLHIQHLVKFIGFLPNAATQIAFHRAVIHVAKIENLPLTLIEALAYGRPIFATPVGGVAEILDHDSVGHALPLDDAATAAQIIANAMQNPEWLHTKGLAARQHFQTRYASYIAAKTLYEFLQK